MAQFIAIGGGFGMEGKNANTYTIAQKKSEAILIGRPSLPSLNFDGRSGSPRRRLKVIVPMETIYEVRRETVPIDMMMLNATTEPM